MYFDRDNNASFNAGDPAVGAPMWAKLVPASGNAIKAAVVDPATGAYTIPLVPAGTYSVIIDDNGTLDRHHADRTRDVEQRHAGHRLTHGRRVSRRWRCQRDGPRLRSHP